MEVAAWFKASTVLIFFILAYPNISRNCQMLSQTYTVQKKLFHGHALLSVMLILWVKNWLTHHLLFWKQPNWISLLREQGAPGGQAAASGAQHCSSPAQFQQLQLSNAFSCPVSTLKHLLHHSAMACLDLQAGKKKPKPPLSCDFSKRGFN